MGRASERGRRCPEVAGRDRGGTDGGGPGERARPGGGGRTGATPASGFPFPTPRSDPGVHPRGSCGAGGTTEVSGRTATSTSTRGQARANRTVMLSHVRASPLAEAGRGQCPRGFGAAGLLPRRSTQRVSGTQEGVGGRGAAGGRWVSWGRGTGDRQVCGASSPKRTERSVGGRGQTQQGGQQPS